MKVLMLTLILPAIYVAQVQSMPKGLGDVCHSNGVEGICKRFRQCPPALEAMKRRISYETCPQNKKLACCVPLTDVQTSHAREKYDECPPIEAKYLNMKKTGQKAWDKCIDWLDYMIPCQGDAAMSAVSSKVRVNKCRRSAVTLIVGGKKAEKDEFPHMAMLGFDDPKSGEIRWDCGGTLISESWVLSAAHCIHNPTTDTYVQYVALGSPDRESKIDPELLFKVDKTVKHPQYKPPSRYNDIMLIKLDKTVKLSPTILPACLHVGNKVNDALMIATGWGRTSDEGAVSNHLLKVKLEKYTHEECSPNYPASRRYLSKGIDDETQLCAGHHTEAKDTCTGDSGGPLQIENADAHCLYTIVGLTSFGSHCGSIGGAAVYTRVSTYVSWIESIVWP